MKITNRIYLIALLVFLLLTLTAVATAYENEEKSVDVDLEFLQYLNDYYTDYPDFIKVDVNFDEVLGIYTYTPIFKGLNDMPLEPGMTYCWCYGYLMREIVTEDGKLLHEPITEEEFMNENSYYIVVEGEFFKRSYGSDGSIHEIPVTADDYLEYYKNILSPDEFFYIESLFSKNSKDIYEFTDELILTDDNSLMTDCTGPCNWGPWQPNPSWCFRNCTRCGKRDQQAHVWTVNQNNRQQCIHCGFIR